MHLAVSFLLPFVIFVAATQNDENQGRQSQAFTFVSPAAVQHPIYNYADLVANARFFRPTVTVVTTSTSTSTATCTRSTSSTCGAGRRKRSVLIEEKQDEQFPISPSAVQGVETTVEPVREARSPNPQMLIYPPTYHYYQPQSPYISSSYSNLYQTYPAATYPAATYPSPLNYYDQLGGSPAANERFFFALLNSFIARTTTSTSTVFTVSTSTSIPICSTTGTLPQCP